MCAGGRVQRSQRQTPFVSMKTFALDAAMTAAAQLTERERREGVWKGGGEGGRVKKKEWSI